MKLLLTISLLFRFASAQTYIDTIQRPFRITEITYKGNKEVVNKKYIMQGWIVIEPSEIIEDGYIPIKYLDQNKHPLSQLYVRTVDNDTAKFFSFKVDSKLLRQSLVKATE